MKKAFIVYLKAKEELGDCINLCIPTIGFRPCKIENISGDMVSVVWHEKEDGRKYRLQMHYTQIVTEGVSVEC